MSATETIIYAIYALAVVLPLLPGLLELRNASDDDPLKIDASYARDPRFLGKSMRNKVIPIMKETAGEDRVPFLNRKHEFAHVVDGLESGDRSTIDDIVLSRGPFSVGDRSVLLDVYAQGPVSVGAASRLRTLAADRGAVFGPGTQVVRWIDVEGDCAIGGGSELGQSVTASGRLILGPDVRFNRLFGRPIAVESSQRAEIRALSTGPILSTHASDRRRVKAMSVAQGETIEYDIVATGDVEVGAEATVTGSIKAGGTVTIKERAAVLGNVVARGSVIIERDGTIYGHIFGNRDVTLHAGALMGDRHAPKTLHASGIVRLIEGATIFGWLIAERGGRSLAEHSELDHSPKELRS